MDVRGRLDAARRAPLPRGYLSPREIQPTGSPQLDDFITPGQANIVGGPCPEEDWFDSLLSLFLSLSLLPSVPQPLNPSSPRQPSTILVAPPRPVPIAFLPPTFLPCFISPWPRAARDDNERRNPAGISVRDKRILTAYEQASALMVPTLPLPRLPFPTLSHLSTAALLHFPQSPQLSSSYSSLLTIGIPLCKIEQAVPSGRATIDRDPPRASFHDRSRLELSEG